MAYFRQTYNDRNESFVAVSNFAYWSWNPLRLTWSVTDLSFKASPRPLSMQKTQLRAHVPLK